MTCINCNHEQNTKFCSNCGERLMVAKITFGSIFKDILSTITNMDKGFLFNVKNLCLNPKEVAIGYIDGKRKNVFNPISFVIVAISLYLIGDALIEVNYEKGDAPSKAFSVGFEAGRFVKFYFKYFWILSILWLSLATKLMFKKHNLAEHLAINSFVIGQATLVGLIVLVILKIIIFFNPFVYLTIIWMTYKIFENKDKNLDRMLQSIVVTFLFFIQWIGIAMVIGLIKTQT